MTKTTQTTESARYGNLARVASIFHVATGNTAELDAAYWYARYAARDGLLALWQNTCYCEECSDRYVADVADSLMFCPDCVQHLSR
jgi:hypothetical protein